MKKVQLERILQSLEPVPAPRADLEQYGTPPAIAGEVAFIALARGDIANRTVLDLGCGNGVLAIAAKLLGAVEVVGADIDAPALEIAGKNAARAKVHIVLRKADVREVTGRFDTILMNPPFGSQTKHADLPFLDHALELGRVLYTFHNAVTEQFVGRRIARAGAQITDRIAYEFPLRRTFPFQKEETHRIPVVLFRVEVAKD